MSEKGKRGFRTVLLAVAVAMIALGIMSGGMMDVFSRAVMICLECVGIG